MTKLPLAVTYTDIEQAAKILAGVAHRTPVMTSRQANIHTKAQIFFKCENFQRVGAFKFRGAYNAISRLTPAQKHQGVVAFSSGNHAQAIALAARLLNVPAFIVMPTDAPRIKLAATREYGAEIILYNRQHENREHIALKIAQERHLTLIPPYDNRDVIAGQGTAAHELITEVGPLDYLFVAVGGGGLLAGSAIAANHLSPACQVIGVEPAAGNDAQQSLRNGKIITIPLPTTIADGAQTLALGQLTFPILRALVKEIITVSDQQLCQQMLFFMQRMKIVVEPTGCLAAAAVMNKVIDVSGKRVGVIISGGNIDTEFFCQCLALTSPTTNTYPKDTT